MKRILLTLAFAAVLPWSAQAAELSYNYVEGDYVNADGDPQGFGVRGSLDFGSSGFYGFAGYTNLGVKNSSLNFENIDAGVGYHYGLSDRAHLIAEASYINSSDSENEFGNIDAYRASVGVRGLFTDRLEGIAKLNYVNGSGLGGTASGSAGLLFKFAQNWGLNAEIELAEQNQQVYTVGVRASF